MKETSAKPTATEIYQRDSDKIDEQALDKYIEFFFETYAPDDEYVCTNRHDLCSILPQTCPYCKKVKSKARFHADLIQLVQRIYVQAQKPFMKQLANLAYVSAPIKFFDEK